MSFQSNAEPESPSLASVLYFLQKEHANFDRERGRYGFYLPLSNMFYKRSFHFYSSSPTYLCVHHRSVLLACCVEFENTTVGVHVHFFEHCVYDFCLSVLQLYIYYIYKFHGVYLEVDILINVVATTRTLHFCRISWFERACN